MMRLSFAVKLARTKLRSKRGLLSTSVVVASLLFAALIALVIVSTGAERSAVNFIKASGNDRYLVRVTPVVPDDVRLTNNNLSLEQIREIKDFEKQYYLSLRQKHKAAGVKYDASQEISALRADQFKPLTLPEEQRVSLDWRSPVLDALRDKKFNEYAKTAPNSFQELQKVGEEYNATGYHLIVGPPTFPALPQSRVIIDNKEDFSVNDLRRDGDTLYHFLINAAYNSTYGFVDDALLERYLLNKDVSNLKGIPVVITAQEAARLFGEAHDIGHEPEAPADKRQWLAKVQEKLLNTTYDVCTRNTVELGMLEKIQRDYVEIKNNKDQSYSEPALQYDYPSSACGEITVKKDNRSAKDRAAEESHAANQKKLGIYDEPEHHRTTFQIVGFVMAKPFSERAVTVESYAQELLSPNNDVSSAQIPRQVYDALPESMKMPNISQQYGLEGDEEAQLKLASRVIEFLTIDDAKSFMDKETCPSIKTECGKLYFSQPHGSNYLVLGEIGQLFQKVANFIFPTVLGLATVIIWFTVSRIMTENRKETAVYRAMGARRRDIAAIYLTYVFMIALMIAAASLMLGFGAAWATGHFYGQALTDTAVTLFGSIEKAPNVQLFDLGSSLLGWVLGAIFVASLVASVQPLARNVRRNPVRDMRDE